MTNPEYRPIFDSEEPDGQPILIDAGDEGDGSRPAVPLTEPQEVGPEPTIDPGQPAEPQGSPAESTAPDHYLFRWRDKEHPIPRSIVSGLREAVEAPSDEAVLNWTQMGRDVAYHRAMNEQQAAARRQELEEYEAAIAQREAQLMAQAQFLRNQQLTGAGQARRQDPRSGGSPTGQGGFSRPASRAATDRQMAGAMPELDSLLRLPDAVNERISNLEAMLIEERNNRDRERLVESYRENGRKILAEATNYLDQLKSEQWVLPEHLTPDFLIREANRLGLSSNPHLSWFDAFETVTSRLLYRSGIKHGQAQLISTLETDRNAGFRPPTTGGRTTLPPQPLNTTDAARSLGARESMRDAVGS